MRTNVSFFLLRDEGFHGWSCEMLYREGVGGVKYYEFLNVQLSLLMQKYCCGHFPFVELNTVVSLRTVQVIR